LRNFYNGSLLINIELQSNRSEKDLNQDKDIVEDMRKNILESKLKIPIDDNLILQNKVNLLENYGNNLRQSMDMCNVKLKHCTEIVDSLSANYTRLSLNKKHGEEIVTNSTSLLNISEIQLKQCNENFNQQQSEINEKDLIINGKNEEIILLKSNQQGLQSLDLSNMELKSNLSVCELSLKTVNTSVDILKKKLTNAYQHFNDTIFKNSEETNYLVKSIKQLSLKNSETHSEILKMSEDNKILKIDSDNCRTNLDNATKGLAKIRKDWEERNKSSSEAISMNLFQKRRITNLESSVNFLKSDNIALRAILVRLNISNSNLSLTLMQYLDENETLKRKNMQFFNANETLALQIDMHTKELQKMTILNLQLQSDQSVQSERIKDLNILWETCDRSLELKSQEMLQMQEEIERLHELTTNYENNTILKTKQQKITTETPTRKNDTNFFEDLQSCTIDSLKLLMNERKLYNELFELHLMEIALIKKGINDTSSSKLLQSYNSVVKQIVDIRSKLPLFNLTSSCELELASYLIHLEGQVSTWDCVKKILQTHYIELTSFGILILTGILGVILYRVIIRQCEKVQLIGTFCILITSSTYFCFNLSVLFCHYVFLLSSSLHLICTLIYIAGLTNYFICIAMQSHERIPMGIKHSWKSYQKG